MNKYCKLLFGLVIVLLISCSSRNGKVIVQNFSIHDSLRIMVLLNGDQIYNDTVSKAVTNIDADARSFSFNKKEAHVKVVIPALNIAATADSVIDELKQIVVIVKTTYKQNPNFKEGDSLFVKADEVSILLRQKVPTGKAL